MAAWVDPVPLARDLVRCASVTPQDAGAQAILARALTDLGCQCRHLPFGGENDPAPARPSANKAEAKQPAHADQDARSGDAPSTGAAFTRPRTHRAKIVNLFAWYDGRRAEGHNGGHESGHDGGHSGGHESGRAEGHNGGRAEGHESGRNGGHAEGHESGGDAHPHLCFAGHTDVVPADNAADWCHPPFSGVVKDGFLHGRGAVDMKGAVACAVAGFARFLNRCPDGAFAGTVSFLITGDEEAEAVNGTAKVLEWMQANGKIPDFCLLAEPTNSHRLGEEMKIGRRGSLSAELIVTGRAGHSAYPERADNPIPPLLEMLGMIGTTRWDDGSAFFAPSHCAITSVDVGNRAANVIPKRARAVFNIRFNDHWSGARLGARLHEILDKAGHPYHLDIHINAEPFRVDADIFATMVADSIHSVTRLRPKSGTGGGTSDARFIHGYCPVVEFGPVSKTIHATDERCPVDDLETLTKIYDDLCGRVFFRPKK